MTNIFMKDRNKLYSPRDLVDLYFNTLKDIFYYPWDKYVDSTARYLTNEFIEIARTHYTNVQLRTILTRLLSYLAKPNVGNNTAPAAATLGTTRPAFALYVLARKYIQNAQIEAQEEILTTIIRQIEVKGFNFYYPTLVSLAHPTVAMRFLVDVEQNINITPYAYTNNKFATLQLAALDTLLNKASSSNHIRKIGVLISKHITNFHDSIVWTPYFYSKYYKYIAVQLDDINSTLLIVINSMHSNLPQMARKAKLTYLKQLEQNAFQCSLIEHLYRLASKNSAEFAAIVNFGALSAALQYYYNDESAIEAAKKQVEQFLLSMHFESHQKLKLLLGLIALELHDNNRAQLTNQILSDIINDIKNLLRGGNNA